MILDSVINDSFELDYEIMQKNSLYLDSNKFEISKFASNTTNKQFQETLNIFKEIIEDLMILLDQCDSQRKNFRTIIIQLMKDKSIFDQFIGENDHSILLNKLKLHEELKSLIITKQIQKISEYSKNLEETKKKLIHEKAVNKELIQEKFLSKIANKSKNIEKSIPYNITNNDNKIKITRRNINSLYRNNSDTYSKYKYFTNFKNKKYLNNSIEINPSSSTKSIHQNFPHSYNNSIHKTEIEQSNSSLLKAHNSKLKKSFDNTKNSSSKSKIINQKYPKTMLNKITQEVVNKKTPLKGYIKAQHNRINSSQNLVTSSKIISGSKNVENLKSNIVKFNR